MASLSTVVRVNDPGHTPGHNELARLHNVLDGSTKTSDAAQTAAIAAAAAATIPIGDNWQYGTPLPNGCVNNFDRRGALTSGDSIGSGQIRFTFFRAPKSFTAANIRMATSNINAAPTACRFGLYSLPLDGTLTLVGSTVNDTALMSVANTVYTKAMSAPVALVKGNWYATALFMTSAGAVNTLVSQVICGSTTPMGANIMALSPRQSGLLLSQTDLQASILPTALAALAVQDYAEILV